MGYNRAERTCRKIANFAGQNSRQEIPRKRQSLSVAKFMQDRLPSPMRERHATLLEQRTEELEKMGAEYHELNVELTSTSEELKGGQTEP